MNPNRCNLYAYILGCACLIGRARYPEVPESWWLTISICSGLLFVSSNCMESAQHWTFLGIDALNLIVLALLIVGGLQVMQLWLVEYLQQRIFAKTAFEFAYRIPRFQA